MKRKTFQIVLCSGILAAFLLLGCSENNSSNDGGSTNDPPAAAQKVEEANTALGQLLNSLINNEGIENPDEVDFSVPYGLYSEALSLDPGNLDANMGAGLCGLMMIAQDPQINAMWDEWSAFLDTARIFEPAGGSGSSSYLIPAVQFPTLENLSNYPIALVPVTLRGLTSMAASNPPMLSDIQTIIEQELLPRLQTAGQRLAMVEGNPNYTFTVTPMMQGDPYEDPVELDLTEVYAMQAEILGAQALGRILISYNVNFNSYDSLGLLQAFNPGTGNSWLSLKSSGAAHMSSAKADLLSALDKMELGIAFLENEVDNQNDDIIKIEPGDEDDLDSIKASIGYARESLEGNWTYLADWDDNSYTPDTEVTFHLAALFDNPIADFKDLIPAYSVTVEVDTTDFNTGPYAPDYVWMEDSIWVPFADYYYWERYETWSYWGGSYGNFDHNIEIPAFQAAYDSALNALQNIPNVSYYNISIYWADNLESGYQPVSTSMSTGAQTQSPSDYRYVVMLHWQASSFEDWIFPNPTFNGFLPFMTDGQFKQTFGLSAEDWQPTLEIPWGDFD